MIAHDLRRQVAGLRELLASGQITTFDLTRGLEAIEEAADRVAEIEAAPVPLARRCAGDEGVVDFRARKAARELEGYLAARGVTATARAPEDDPEGAA